jgi:hypothetical protein
MEPHEGIDNLRIDNLLRRSMAAPVPSLPPDFDRRVMRKLDRKSQPLDRYFRILMTGYGLLSVVVSASVMRGQGLGWGAIAVTILAPLALLATTLRVRSAIHSTVRSAGS